jgi:hypothetical protein
MCKSLQNREEGGGVNDHYFLYLNYGPFGRIT